jgi:hypothetical protein
VDDLLQQAGFVHHSVRISGHLPLDKVIFMTTRQVYWYRWRVDKDPFRTYRDLQIIDPHAVTLQIIRGEVLEAYFMRKAALDITQLTPLKTGPSVLYWLKQEAERLLPPEHRRTQLLD